MIRFINRCPHVRVRGIYGDEINHSAGYRLACRDCGRLLDGPVSIAQERGGNPEVTVRNGVVSAKRTTPFDRNKANWRHP